jgi:carboxymethylenebutenolidase
LLAHVAPEVDCYDEHFMRKGDPALPQTNIAKEKITLNVSDGTGMGCYVARPDDSSAHPGIIVLQEAFGVNSHIRNVAERFAAQGYIAIAPELFHRTAPGFEGSYTDFPAVRKHMEAMTVPGGEADLRAAFDWLQNQKNVQRDRICSTGFCMGGRMSFMANSILPLHAAASFYGGGIAPALLDRAPRLHAPMLFFWGGLDKHIPPEQRNAVIDALRTAGKTYANVEFSDADHGFNCDERASYQPRAARQSWAMLLEFLQS